LADFDLFTPLPPVCSPGIKHFLGGRLGQVLARGLFLYLLTYRFFFS
jgi:hypothetical protein